MPSLDSCISNLYEPGNIPGSSGIPPTDPVLTSTSSAIFGGTGVAWTPAALADLAIWFKGDDLVGAGGSSIPQWTDASGHSRNATQATSTNQPAVDAAALNGKNVCLFTSGGVNQRRFDLPNLNSAFGTTSGSLISLIKATADPAADVATGPQLLGASVSGELWPHTDGTIFNGAMSNARRNCGNPSTNLAAWHIAGIRSATNDFQVWLNGLLFFSDGTNTVAWTSTPQLGAGASFGWEGRIAEWVLVVPALTAGGADWQKLEGYLAHKWGVQSVLDVTHPYKSAPPTIGGVALGGGSLRVNAIRVQTTASVQIRFGGAGSLSVNAVVV
jgi:hypothetical protein